MQPGGKVSSLFQYHLKVMFHTDNCRPPTWSNDDTRPGSTRFRQSSLLPYQPFRPLTSTNHLETGDRARRHREGVLLLQLT